MRVIMQRIHTTDTAGACDGCSGDSDERRRRRG